MKGIFQLLSSLALGSAFLLAIRVQVAWTQQISADDVKAAMVFNFIRFSTLPVASEKINLCVSASYPGVAQLRALQGKSVGNSFVHVEVVGDLATCEPTRCQVAVYHELSPKEAANLAGMTKRGVLTIGQDPAFVERGGVIRFFNESNKVRFEIDNTAARAAGINISSKVLALARIRDSSE
jgi:hypothetical protein